MNELIPTQETEQPIRAEGWLLPWQENTPQWRNQARLSLGGIQRVLVVRLDNIGDVVLLGPSLRALRETLPQASITLLTSPAGRQAAPLLPWVDETLVCEALWQDVSGHLSFDPQREIQLIEELRSHDFQLALIFTSFSQSPFPAAYACYMAGIPHRVGFSKEFGGRVLSLSPAPPPDEMHQAERNLCLLEQLDLPLPLDHQLELTVPEDARRRADELLAALGIGPDRPFIALAPGASCASRRYDPQRFAEAARMLTLQTALPLVVLGSDREAETLRPVVDVPHVRSLVGLTSVPEFAALIRRSSLVIGGNSSALHMADAFQTPMVILYSGTDLVSQWMPRNAPARLLVNPVFCSPCYGFDCPYQMNCLDIRPQEVVTAALEMLTGKVYRHIHIPLEIKVPT